MAQSSREIRRRIQSVTNTQQITKAMEMIAAAKLRKAQERVEKSRPYLARLRDTTNRMLEAMRLEGSALPRVAGSFSGSSCLIVVTADRGLAGGYNANVLRQAEELLRENPATQLLLIGRKARDFFRRRDVPYLAEYVGMGDTLSFREAQDIGALVSQFMEGELFTGVSILYTEFLNTVSQRVCHKRILPFEPDATDKQKGITPLTWYEPSLLAVLESLLPLYLRTTIFQALLEAHASEQGARMNAMHSATDNAGELIKSLNLSYNRARQAAITTEISEIVGGAEALQA